VVQFRVAKVVFFDLGASHVLQNCESTPLAELSLGLANMLQEQRQQGLGQCDSPIVVLRAFVHTLFISSFTRQPIVVPLLVFDQFALHGFLEQNLVAQDVKHVLFALSMVVKVVLRLASEHCWRQIVRLKRLHQVCDFYMVKLAVASLCEIDQLARLHSMLAHSPLAIL